MALVGPPLRDASVVDTGVASNRSGPPVSASPTSGGGSTPIPSSTSAPSVGSMCASESQLRCYLAECYRSELTRDVLDEAVVRLDESVASMCAQGSRVRLLMAVAVPNDELFFGVFVAGSEDVVARVCRDAGMPAQRLSPAIEAVAGRGTRATADSARTPAS